jgi:hypothetical protein
VVDNGTMLVVVPLVTQAVNDKQRVAPVFGIIKSVPGFRQFLTIWLEKVFFRNK